MIKVAIDAMGGDYAPDETVKGAVSAVQSNENVHVFLVGKPEAVHPLLDNLEYDKNRITMIPAAEVIETGEHPVQAIRTKKDSSMSVGMKLVHNGEADAFVSGGNSGALMVGAQVIVGRDKDVDRAPFAHVIPTAKGHSLLLDCGANVDVRPDHILTFARLGIDYLRKMKKISKPTVGLVNIGKEEAKGNELTKAAYSLLKEQEDINFIGNVEPTGITAGEADILVCDGFTGNIIIKLYEGMGKMFLGIIKKGLTSNIKTKIGALLIKKSLKEQLEPFDSHKYGGAPILGLRGLVLKTHGNATSVEFSNAILQCVDYIKDNK